MQEHSDGKEKTKNKIPVHVNQSKALHDLDLFKTSKMPLVNALKCEKDIDDERFMTQIKNSLFSKQQNLRVIKPVEPFIVTLNNYIFKTNTIVTNTCNFINAFVIHEFVTNKSITKITIPYINLVMKTVSKRENTDGRPSKSKNNFNSFFESKFKKTMTDENYAYDDRLSFVLKYEAMDILTNIEVNITEHYIDHLYKFVNIYFKLKQKLIKLKEITNKDTQKKVSEEMFNELNKIKRDLIQNQPNLKKLVFESSKQHHEWIKTTKKHIMPQRKFAKNSIHYDVHVKPQDYLGYMIWINRQFEHYSTESNTIKLFHAMPLRTSFIPKHITLDTAGLINIFNDKGGNKQMFAHINDNKDEIWSRYFKTNSKNFLKKGYEFSGTIKTDGVSISISFVKQEMKNQNGKIKKYTKTETNEIEKKRDNLENKYIEDVENIDKIFENKSYICIDPNAGDLIHGIVGNFEKYKDNDVDITIEKHFNYTRNQRRKECKVKKYKQIRNELTSEKIKLDPKSPIATMIAKMKSIEEKVFNATILEVQNVLSNYNSKTCNLNNFLNYVACKNMIDVIIRDVYRQKIFRKLKINTHINAKKSESKMVTNLKEKIGNPEKVIIIYGDYDDKGNHIKGKESIVSKKLRKVLREVGYKVYLINEYNTSALCNICEHRTEECLTRISKKPKYKGKNKKEEVWGLRRCSNLNCLATTKKGKKCRRLYNRDDNACMNMIKIVEHIRRYGKRKANYCRPTKP